MDDTGLTVVRQGIRVVEISIRTEHFKWDSLQEVLDGEPVELTRAFAPMKDTQAIFQILHLSADFRLSHLLRASCCRLQRFDGGGVGVCLAGDGTAAVGLPTLEEVANDPTVCQNQTCLGHEADPPARRECGLGITRSNSNKGAAYICCPVLVLGRVVTVLSRGNLPSLLEWLPGRSMASVLLEELKILATEVKKSQIEDAMGSLWIALSTEEDH